MGLIEMPLGDAREPETVSDGRYDLRIEAQEEKENPNTGKKSIQVIIKIENPPAGVEPMEIMHFIALPRPDDTPQGRKFKLLQTARFLHLFDIPYNEGGFDPDDLPGSTASGVTVTQGDVEGYGPRNNIDLSAHPLPKEAD